MCIYVYIYSFCPNENEHTKRKHTCIDCIFYLAYGTCILHQPEPPTEPHLNISKLLPQLMASLQMLHRLQLVLKRIPLYPLVICYIALAKWSSYGWFTLIYPLKMMIVHFYVSLPDGNIYDTLHSEMLLIQPSNFEKGMWQAHANHRKHP